MRVFKCPTCSKLTICPKSPPEPTFCKYCGLATPKKRTRKDQAPVIGDSAFEQPPPGEISESSTHSGDE